MNLADLQKQFPFQWKVQSLTARKDKYSCVAYVDARDVMGHLDKVCGPENWQDEYYSVKDTLCCKIGIKIGTEWVWKSDGGAENDNDKLGAGMKTKGEISDAFKRAAVKWGVGRFLYDQPIQYVGAKEVNGRFQPVSQDGEILYADQLTTYINSKLKK